jgi:hypothetical protein
MMTIMMAKIVLMVRLKKEKMSMGTENWLEVVLPILKLILLMGNEEILFHNYYC